jgi:hypothetical protein
MTLFKNYPLAIEFRDVSWNDKWVINELQDREVAFCNVDQPRLGNSLDGTKKTHVSLSTKPVCAICRTQGNMSWFVTLLTRRMGTFVIPSRPSLYSS